MNFDFSDDQKLLKEQVRKFLTDKCPTKVVRRVLDGNETHAEEVWKGFVGRRPQTMVRLTLDGRKRFIAYLEELERIVRDAAAAGLRLLSHETFLRYQYMLVFTHR